MRDLPVLDERATFIDVGSEHMHVSIAGGEPRVFGTVTSQLHALRDWLKSEGVRSVAMEATGVYWLPLYSALEDAGMQVCMVNGRQTRNLPGRKTDMQDSQWGATLHAHGLLRAGFVPSADIRRLQDYLRLRADHIAAAASHVQHMQKALERMNVKLHDVISSLAGASGLAVVRAIVAGERSPDRLLALCDKQIQRSKAERVKESLRGTWAAEHVFASPGAAKLGALPRLGRRMRSPDRGATSATRRRCQHEPQSQSQARRRQRSADRQLARDAHADVRRSRPHATSRPHPLRRPATRRRGRHRSDQVAERETLHFVDGASPRKPRQR